MPKLALYQPDIAGNVGTLIRLCACLDVGLDIIEPCSFPWDERKIRQSALDYYHHVKITRHNDWDHFKSHNPNSRIVLLTTKTTDSYIDFNFEPGDILLAGSESAGVPEQIHNSADKRITIPMKNGQRSLNIAIASAMILGEALRQTNGR